MTSPELENLVRIGALKREPPSRQELDGLVHSGAVRLADAERSDLSGESRFDLAYNAAHALALAALRRMGYRSDNRYLVFQALAHTTGLPSATWRVLSKCHERRNLAEYEGLQHVDERLVCDLLRATRELLDAVHALPPPDAES
jgi:hypothetical protein